eukprot:664087-Amphidinium_carterae.1
MGSSFVTCLRLSRTRISKTHKLPERTLDPNILCLAFHEFPFKNVWYSRLTRRIDAASSPSLRPRWIALCVRTPWSSESSAKDVEVRCVPS